MKLTTSNKINSFTRIALLIILTSAVSEQVYGLRISEIMFNPDGADTGREWIEIELNESDGCINLTEYKLLEESTNHNIYSYYDELVCDYAIVCNDVNKFLLDYAYLNNSAANVNHSSNIQIYKSTFTLSNSGEELALKRDAEFIDYIDYGLILSQVSIAEGHSVEYVNDAWRSSILIKGNPGNELDEKSENDTNIIENNSSILYNDGLADNTNITYDNNSGINITSNITDNTTIENTSIINDIDINITTNITTNLTNNNTIINNTDNSTNNNTNSSDNINRCQVSIKTLIKNNSMIYENNIPIKFYNILEFENSSVSVKNYSIEYWIEDLSGNMIKNKVITSNQDEKTYTPKIDADDKVLMIKNVLRDIDCNTTKNSSEILLIIRNSEYDATQEEVCPSCECESTKKVSSTDTSTSDDTYSTCSEYIQICNEKPLMKIVNVCNDSMNVSKNYLNTQKNVTQTLKELSNTNNVGVGDSDFSNKTQNTGKTTGMIVYESPNLKNRIYAIIGLILVGVTCLGMIFYRLFKRKSDAVI